MIFPQLLWFQDNSCESQENNRHHSITDSHQFHGWFHEGGKPLMSAPEPTCKVACQCKGFILIYLSVAEAWAEVNCEYGTLTA